MRGAIHGAASAANKCSKKDFRVEKRTLGRTGLAVSVLGFGGAPIGYLETEQKQVASILNRLLDEGVNLIDTAASYRGSEEAIGKAIGRRREEFVLVSKCGPAFEDLSGEAWSPTVITQTVDRSLKRLQTDYIDVMLLHSCDLETLKKGDALGALIKARDAGKVRFVGYSGDNEAAQCAAGMEEIAVIQTSINICDQANIEMVLPKTLEHNVGVIAKRPLANAPWKDVADQRGLYKEYAKPYTQRLSQMQINPGDLGFKGDPADVWPEIALRFTISEPGVHSAIIGTTNPEHLAANIEAARKGRLPEQSVLKIRQAFRSAEERSGERWIGQN